MGRARLQIWDPDNATKLADTFVLDDESRQRNFDDVTPTGSKLNESGSGGLVLQGDHPAAEHAVPGNVVRLVSTTSSKPLYAFTITERDHVQVHKVQKDRTITVDGEDLLERWDDSTVDPWTAGRPISADRIWNWAAPRGFDDSGWSTASYAQTRIVDPKWPAAYPMAPAYAGQLWTRPYANPQPVGSTLWRRPFTLVSAADLAIWQASDDAANQWVDGVLVNQHSIVWPDTSGWQKAAREVPPCSAGDHVAAFEAFNFGGPAYFMSSAFTVVGGVLGSAVFSTGDGLWRWLDYPSVKPGFTAPEIMQMLLDEAQDRSADELAGWSITVHGTHENIEEFSVRVGSSYREVLASLTSVYCDIAADSEGLELHMWPKGEIGTVTSVDIPDTAIRVLQQIDNDDVTNDAQGVWSDGSRRVTRAAHPMLGVKSKSLQLGGVTDPAAVDRILNAYLDAHEEPAPAIVGEFRDVLDAVAGEDYGTGDVLELSGTSVLCTGLNWTVDQVTGELVPVPQFDSLIAVRRREVELAIDRMASKFEAPATASMLSSKPLLVSGYPATQEWTWSWADDIEDALNEIDPEKPWQIKRPETVQRFWKFMVEIDPADLPDAWGNTIVELWKNGSLIDGLYNLMLSTVVPKAEVLIWGYETVTPGESVQVACTTAGGHVDGAITVSLADAV